MISCNKKQSVWISEYAKTKCKYQTEKEKLKTDSVKLIAPLNVEKENLQKELRNIAEPFQDKIDHLKEKINEAEIEYLSSYRKLTDEQNLKHGHVSTSDYEKAVVKIQTIKEDKIRNYQIQISSLVAEMQNNNQYKTIDKKFKSIKTNISNHWRSIEQKYKAVLDSLQEQLNNQNSDFKQIVSELSTDERHSFEQKRNIVKNDPCNYKKS